MRYKVHECGQYEPPACPGCLRRQSVEWQDVTMMMSDDEPMFMPTYHYCTTSGCSYNPAEQAR
jgi:hypothetical protein